MAPVTRRVAHLVLIAVALAACSTTSAATPAATTSPPSATRPPTSSAAAILAGAGVATVADETSSATVVPVTAARSPYEVTVWQAAVMDDELGHHGGIPATAIDAAAPVPQGATPISWVIAAWASQEQGPAPDAARRIMGDQDWVHADHLRFPTIVLALFVGDVSAHLATPGTGPQGFAAMTGGGIVDAPCSTVSNFVDKVLTKVFNALKVDRDAVSGYVSGALGGGGLANLIGQGAGWLADLLNHAVDLAQQAAEALISALTKPVVDAIRLAIGVVATISTVASYLKTWHADVVASQNPDRYAVGTEPDRTGTLTVKVDPDGESSNWPDQLVDCAKVLDKPLPSLSKPGLPVEWKLDWESTPGAVTFDRPGEPYKGTLDNNLTSSLGYTTGREDEATSHGTEQRALISVDVAVRRTEVEDLKAIIEGFTLGQVPAIARPVVGPILQAYISDIVHHLDSITSVDGNVILFVIHHRPPEPTTTTIPPCDASAKVPAGTYAGDLGGSVTLVEHRPGTGRIAEAIDASHLALTSDGTTVTGRLTLHWHGEGDLDLGGGVTFHVAEDSTLTDATISGPVAAPVVDGTVHGTETVDGDATSADRPVHVQLPLTQASCAGIGGDVAAILNQLVDGQLVTIEGSAPWQAAKQS